jgi:transglutaminase-like putative cysteine protease
MLYEVTHTTTYDYTDPVSVSHHILRLHPRALPHQHCLSAELHIEPAPSVSRQHTDYFGNVVTYVTIQGMHRQLTIKSINRVEVADFGRPFPDETPAWETVRDLSRGPQIGSALEASEFLFDSPLVKTENAFVDYAAPSFSRGRPILDAVLDLTGRIHRDFKFDPQATTISTPLHEVFKKRRGVCQDFAHMQIACLRSLGLSARYVSGYLETDPPPGQARLAGADASHAWISFFCAGIGWIDVDPTNNLLPGTRHITAAWGRDYSDISPTRGVIVGNGAHTISIAVDVVSLR